MKKQYIKIIKGIFLSLALAAIVVAAGVSAQGESVPPITDDFTGGAATTEVKRIENAQTIVQSIVGWVQLFFYIIATLMIILAAYDYLSSGGDETKVKSAKGRVIYAIVAIAIAVVAGGGGVFADNIF